MIKDAGILTYALIALTGIVAIVGGAVVIWGHPGALSFDDYIRTLEGFAASIGLLGIGKGVALNGAARTAPGSSGEVTSHAKKSLKL